MSIFTKKKNESTFELVMVYSEKISLPIEKNMALEVG